ncbi:MAG: bi-domain-containing oxidoreductase [Coriobacteriales bacterium]|jgi:predicted dehydrogenase/threonine dehydrogenase-like Zn-dependent dehydrogenase|nr:bi-domain-containing oxidoreductase [Coriobacteriales bacterium]
MRQLFLLVSDGSVKLVDTPCPTPKEKHLIVETLYSAVSAGSERSLTSFGGKNLISKVLERPDQAKKVMDKIATDGFLTAIDAAFNKLGEPMPMGYSAVGKVISCGRGVTDVQPGDLVAVAGQAYHAEVNRVNRNLVAKLPANFPDIRQAAFCALGGIALEGIHQAQVMPGETVAVIGMGLVGQIVTRVLDAYGCDVIGFDVADKSREGTRLKAFLDSSDENAEDQVRGLTAGRGVDKVIITAATDSNAPMDLAAAIARDRAVICMIGVTKMDIDRRPFYKKELTFTIARSYGPGRYDVCYEETGVDYPIGQVRFTEGRNFEEFVRLISTGRLDLSDLITHTISFDDAERAYEMITTNKNHEPYLGIVLQYAENVDKFLPLCGGGGAKQGSGRQGSDKSVLNVGLIGAGSFARSTMLPLMRKTGKYHFRAIATTGGISAAQTSEMEPFDYETNDYHSLLEDDSIDLIAISTQHNTHATFIIEALQAGKNVYCEKPLCLSLDELEAIMAAYQSSAGELFCGMNRRYAPLIQQLKSELKTDAVPAVYNYVANAGQIPPDHWTQGERRGGGRIIGEACHFVDVIQYLDGSTLEQLDILFASNPAYPCKDNAVIRMGFSSGAVANIIYTSMGSKKYPKEELQVFSNGCVCTMSNYLKLEKYGASKSTTTRLRQDKGIEAEYQMIFDVITGKTPNEAITDAFIGHLKLLEALYHE